MINVDTPLWQEYIKWHLEYKGKDIKFSSELYSEFMKFKNETK